MQGMWSDTRAQPAAKDGVMKRCVDCGRLPDEDHCSICHRVARALARMAENLGYPETAREMRELLEEVNPEAVNQ